MKEKKVLLVFPDISERSWHKGYFHYGLAHISAYLKQNVRNIQISLLPVGDKNLSQIKFYNRIKEFQPHIIGFTSTTHSFPLVQKMAGWVKKFNRNILTVCGGVHATIEPNEALLSSEIDVVVCGDGEYPMESLVNEWIEYGTIPSEKGLWHQKDRHIVNNGCAIVADLDSLPDPDWELFDYMDLDEGSQGIGGLMLSRGCPYQCSYCCNHKLANIYKESKIDYMRFKSVKRSISEIKNFLGRFPKMHTLYFDDDILPLKKQWFLDFADSYKKEINMPYWCNIRPNLVDSDIVEAFIRSGCVRAGIGIESGNSRIRNEILKRGISDEAIVNAVSLLKRNNIYVYTFNMVGIPKETKNELLDTIKMNAKLDVDKIQCSVFYPYKHTALYDFIIKEGFTVSEKSLIEYTHESILKLSFTQKNRVYFTVLTMELVTKVYRMLPGYLSGFFLKILYSSVSAAFFLPIANKVIRNVLVSKRLAVKIKKLYRLIIPPPPTAMTKKRAEIEGAQN